MRKIDDGIRRSSRTVDCQMCTQGILYAMASMSLVTGGQNVGSAPAGAACFGAHLKNKGKEIIFP